MRLPGYKYFLAAIDLAILLLSFFEARYILLISGKINTTLNDPSIFGISYSYIALAIVSSIIFILLFQNNNLYKINIFLTRAAQLALIIKSILYGVILLIVFSFLIKTLYIIDSRLLITTLTVILLINFIVFRVGVARLLYLKFSKTKTFLQKAAIIGAGESGKLLAAKFSFEDFCGVKLIGFIDDGYPTGTTIISDLKILGDTEELSFIRDNYDIDELIISIDNISYPDLLDLIDKCNESKFLVKLNSNLFKIIPQKFETESYFNIPVVEVSQRVNAEINSLSKKIFDFIASLIGIIILSPLFMMIALLIRLSSKGPILFKQLRIGKNGKPFLFYKFRSMTVSNNDDNERKAQMIKFMKNNMSMDNNNTKIINESRVTGIGKFIRKTSFDELPQLVNVLKGEMSLVGPRPCLPYEYEQYDEWQKRRVSVIPGCTGVWQVAGRSNVSFNDSIVLDLYYLNNMSPWLDLQLIIKTVPVMLFGKGGK
jgi:undecaprenyl-phosphate galactose phosphotransferase